MTPTVSEESLARDAHTRSVFSTLKFALQTKRGVGGGGGLVH